MYRDYKEAIDRFIYERKDLFLRDLDDLMSVPSVSEDIDEVKRALRLCIEKAKGYGLKAETILNDQIGIVEMGEGDETLGILAHVDVVDPGNKSEWKYPPYRATLADGYIWGRGSQDDKGPLLCTLYAMMAVKELGINMHKKVQLIIGTQEEVKWKDIEAYVANCRLPDFSFTPDGEFPIGNREKGYADIVLKFGRKEGERGTIEITDLNGGTAVNSIPDVASAILKGNKEEIAKRLSDYLNRNPDKELSIEVEDDLTVIKAKGAAAHSCYPEKGVNAIWILADFLKELDLMDNGAYYVVKFINEIAAGDFEGAPFGLAKGNVYVNGEDMHKTVMSVTMMRTEKDGYRLYYNIRQTYGVHREDVEKGFAKYSHIYGYTVEIVEYMDAIYVDSNKPFVKLMERIYNENTPWTSYYNLEYGTSYAKALPNCVCWGPIFPDEEDTCHEINEKAKFDNMILSTRLFSYFIAEVVSSDKKLRE